MNRPLTPSAFHTPISTSHETHHSGQARLYIAIVIAICALAALALVTQDLVFMTRLFWGVSMIGWLPVMFGLARSTFIKIRARFTIRKTKARLDLPTITILLPLYGEANMLVQLAQAMARLDYPADKLDCMVLVEADDTQTCIAATSAPWPSFCRLLSVPVGVPKTKARACNYAMHRVRGDVLVIFDAEDQPHPGQLREAAHKFISEDSRLACLQAPLCIMPQPNSWLQHQFALEYQLLFRFILPYIGRASGAFPLGGSSNYFRLDALRHVGGWDDYNLTEDADLGLKLAQHGYRLGTLRLPTYENAPNGFGNWYRQRTRWLSGHIQTLHTHVPHLHTHRKSLLLSTICASVLLGCLTSAPAHVLSCLLIVQYFLGTISIEFFSPATLLPSAFYLFLLVVLVRIGPAQTRIGRIFITATHWIYWLLTLAALLNALKRMAFGQLNSLKSPHTPYLRRRSKAQRLRQAPDLERLERMEGIEPSS